MLTPVDDARAKVLKACRPLAPEILELERCLGRVLSRDLKALSPYPLYSVSAMDGYALRARDAMFRPEVLGELKAGDPPARLRPGTALKIMTGAVLPAGADAVVPLERTKEKGGLLRIEGEVDPQDHIRRRGEEVKKGSLVVKAGTRMHARWLGALANLGFGSLPVRRTPRVVLLCTGSEIRPAGSRLKPGQIFDSNTPMLAGLLRESGCVPVFAGAVPDQPGPMVELIQAALAESDVVILVGGVSVGGHDHSKAVFAKAGVRKVFWGVAQKPGKPLFFGRKGRCLAFGLPGNPAAAFTCFHEYVLPALLALQGASDPFPKMLRARLMGGAKPDSSRSLFLKARLEFTGQGAQVTTLKGQGSHMLSSLASGNALAFVRPGLKAPALLEVHPL